MDRSYEPSIEAVKATFEAATPKTSYTPVGKAGGAVYGEPEAKEMSHISREEFLARLEATEAKVDARYSRFETTMATSLAEITKEIHSIKGQIASDVAAARGEVSGLNGKLESVNAKVDALKNVKGNVWGAAVTVLVLTIGLVTLVVNALSTGVGIRGLLGGG